MSLKGRLLAALFLCGLVQGTGHAHGGARSDVRVEMAPVRLPGLTVQLHQDYIAPQIVVGNQSGKLLEILDEKGRVFLRIGPKQAQGDVRAEAFHRSRGTAGADLRPGMISATPKWQQINAEAAYGWFDPRIATEYLEIPKAILALDGETPFGEWRVAARFDGKPVQFRGVFLHVPLPKGSARARLVSPTEPAPGVQVSVAPSRPPSIFINNRSPQKLEVLDARGEAFLRIGLDGVWARADSAAFKAANPEQAVQGRGWVKLNAGSSHAWLDGRAGWAGRPTGAQQAGKLNDWTLPLTLGGKPLDLRGVNEWVPITGLPAASKIP